MRMYLRFVSIALIAAAASCVLTGCFFHSDPPPDQATTTTSAIPAPAPTSKSKVLVPPVALTQVDLSDAVHPVMKPGAVELAIAKNEWTSFVLQVGPRQPIQAGGSYSLRVAPPTPGATVEIYQVLPMPVDVNRAGYIRHTGQIADRNDLPRALLPMKLAADGSVDLSTLRDASRPADAKAAAPLNAPALLWVDIRVPADAKAGEYTVACDAIASGKVVSSVPMKVKVHDFALPAERHLQVIGQLDWDDLERLYADRFESIRPRLMNRNDEKYTGAVRVIDSLMALAHRHRTTLIVPRLQPTVKWPPGAPPEVRWDDFDSLVAPWMKGEGFEDKLPVGFWPIPAPDMLDNYKRESQLQYWTNAATHFDQNDWIDRAPIWLDKGTPGRASDAEAAEASRLAAETIELDQRLRVSVPLEMDQLRVAQPGDAKKPGVLDPTSTARLLAAAPALVTAPPMRLWPDAVNPPVRYIRADMPSLVPYVGAGGDERDVRLWAWLAFLRDASLIHFADALPSLSEPTTAADPNELIWFYPGEWFGLDKPVPTIQLKWLRRAQQDYEYLWLAREAGERVNSLMMAQLIAKPVEIQPGQTPDPTYSLMSGTTNQQAWVDAKELLAELILLHAGGAEAPVDPVRSNSVGIQVLRWQQPQERPLLMGRAVQWQIAQENDSLLSMKFGIDIYNASAITPRENQLAWTDAPLGWEISPQPAPAPALTTYNVRRGSLDATFKLSSLTAISSAQQKPFELTFTDGFTKRASSLKLKIPVATSDRREGGRLSIDGQLENDWFEADAIHAGPMVKMLSRPSLQRQTMELAATQSKVFTSWAENNFYVAFDVAGISPSAVARAQNFVDYQFRRAWSEDLCELLIQPIGADGLPGPVLHVVCKPNGSTWVERKTNANVAAGKPWQEVEAGIQHASRTEGERWRGEIKIPWKAILDAAAPNNANKGASANPLPTLLRFNFAQHRAATGESASWSGPVDFGRDDNFMGVLYLRDPEGRRDVARDGKPLPQAPAER